MQQDIDELKDKKICSDCIEEEFLKETVKTGNAISRCDYCGKNGPAIGIGDLSDAVNEAFETHFRQTSPDPSSLDYAMMSDKESEYDWQREGEPAVYAIMNAAQIPEVAARDVQQVLEDENSSYDKDSFGTETPYHRESHYEELAPTGTSWSLTWNRFEAALRTESRFFSKEAEEKLASIFAGLPALKTDGGQPVIVKAGPATAYPHIFRSRVFQSDKRLAQALKHIDLELAGPPPEFAAAGRMNARGISVFYGATDCTTALTEVRPPVGSRVLLARFDIIKELSLLDLPALGDIAVHGSVFDPAYGERLERATFLRTLGERMTRPVMPDDEALDYLVTQAVADYLATNYAPQLDGIIYRSVQTRGGAKNVVLFHKAARVEPLVRPFGTEVSSSLGHWGEDGWEEEYDVVEEIPDAAPKEPEDPLDAIVFHLSKGLYELETDYREPVLRLDGNEIEVHRITAVAYEADKNRVRHFRWKKDDADSPI